MISASTSDFQQDSKLKENAKDADKKKKSRNNSKINFVSGDRKNLPRQQNLG